jgi:predicted Zn-dependent protease
MRRAPVLLAAALALAAGSAARAQEGKVEGDLPAQPLVGSGLVLSGAPTIQELQAQQRQCEIRKPPRKSKGTINESTYKRMERIQDQIAKGDNAGAEAKLIELKEQARGDYEKAIVLQTLAFVYATQNKNGPAVKAFEEALAQNALPQQVHEQMMFNISQIYLQDDKIDKSMEMLNAYLAESCNPLPDAHVMLASVYAEKKRFRDALKQVDLALVKSKAPKEGWLQVKLALHYELKEFPRCAEVLVFLLALAPQKENYWKQLHGILFEIKKDPEALAVLALAERKGFVDEEGEIRNLANMYMYMGIPLKAGQVLQRGLDSKVLEASEKNLEMLSNAWLSARENDKAEAVLKKAAAVSGKGELYKQLGYIYAEKMDWKASLEALEQAQKKGGIKEPGDLQLMIAQAAVELHQFKRAQEAVKAAMQHEKTAKIATQWLAHVQQEEEYALRKQAAAEEKKQPATQTN